MHFCIFVGWEFSVLVGSFGMWWRAREPDCKSPQILVMLSSTFRWSSDRSNISNFHGSRIEDLQCDNQTKVSSGVTPTFIISIVRNARLFKGASSWFRLLACQYPTKLKQSSYIKCQLHRASPAIDSCVDMQWTPITTWILWDKHSPTSQTSAFWKRIIWTMVSKETYRSTVLFTGMYYYSSIVSCVVLGCYYDRSIDPVDLLDLLATFQELGEFSQ